MFLGLANFSLDDATDFSVYLPALAGVKTVQVRMLDSQGRWRAFDRPLGDGGRLAIRGPLAIPDQEIRAYEIIRQA